MINFYCHLWLAILCFAFKTDGILVKVWPLLLIFSTKGLFFYLISILADSQFYQYFFVMTQFRLSSINLYDTTPSYGTHLYMYYSITPVGALFYGKWNKLQWGGPRWLVVHGLIYLKFCLSLRQGLKVFFEVHVGCLLDSHLFFIRHSK